MKHSSFMTDETGEIIKSKFKFAIYEDEECTKLIKEEEHTVQNHLALFLTSLINRGTAILILYIINCIVF